MNKNPKILEKLERDFKRSIENKISGHMIGFHAAGGQTLQKITFSTTGKESGEYTIRSKTKNFYWFNYDPLYKI
jgi:hypothetical protein